MSDDLKVTAELRESFGKGAARKLRALGKIPAVLYGHGTEPVHVSLPGHQMLLILRKSNAVLELDIAGKGQLALVKDVQKDPVRQIIEHLDLIVVKKGEKVQVDIPVTIEGESAAGTILNQDATTVSLEVEATHIPERVTVSVEGLEEGAQILAGDLELPKGASLITEADVLIVAITVPAAPADEETEAAEAAAEETAAEAAE
ncbi:50S ribosomal protein L25/general stress protein Ctc [Plantibacter sp. VKM Ac-2885]|jgi:large subunit ribosomal protein L25|uniref:Large ribosomal subunit protein bL25 n=1 Tax=Plantibacter cousiniae (nom. nud.) TaxID=199709 RepID=A0ABY1LK61_9MICO|nr:MULTISPECIES: 50S ribosomal protein L25/general stress protein Ctc [Plantibacter]AZH83311.1 50S ribosomal protein L25/general stress protein Ctc [Plantibacter sp. PA-3-X8]MBD8102339.1 50S ribosomal protein L25/general stress protein Ctc [Plantibacter sp. CFBP 8775]MBD8466962.1 50S ribosomal protein L25/general stress protein Ctc [Plantibacter sp. CFBP 8798]MBD8516151.1 50S ribosomal protein L25/general stress protein Ctc [Plantibacter sp. CFBP 8804]MBF4512431.1 50S ribosomal protein L25/gen